MLEAVKVMLRAEAEEFAPTSAWQALCWAQQASIGLLLGALGASGASAQRLPLKDAGTQAEASGVLRRAASGPRAPPPEGP